jgi:toxin ParE1/3/4
MRVRWTRRALRSLDALAEYIAQDRPLAAERMVERIRDTVDRLTTNPELGRTGRVHGTRELIVGGTPFIVPYRLREDVVEIITIFHAARRWPDRF